MPKSPAGEFIDVLDAVFSLEQAVTDSRKDGKVNFLDIPNFLGFATKLPTAINNIQEVKGLYPDFSDEEKLEITTYVKEKFDIEDDEVEEIIEEGVTLVADLLQYTGKLQIRRRNKAAA